MRGTDQAADTVVIRLCCILGRGLIGDIAAVHRKVQFAFTRTVPGVRTVGHMADDAADTGHFHDLAAEARRRQTFPLAAGQQLHIGVVLDLTDLRILL